MGSLSEEVRLKRIREAFEHWQRLSDSRRYGDDDEGRKKDLIDKLMPYVAEEGIAAVSEDRVACVFCGLWYVVDCATGEEAIYSDDRGDDTVIREGIRTAGDTFAENRNKHVSEHVKSCIAAELARLRDRRITEEQSKSPEELLSAAVHWPRPNAAVLLEHLTFEQRSGLLELLFARTERKSLVMQLRDEPENELLWRIWYTLALQVIDPAVEGIFEEDNSRPIIVLLGESWGKPPPKGVNPAGPMHARFYQQLVKELKRRRYPIRDPDSEARIARLTGQSRSTTRHYLVHDQATFSVMDRCS